MREIKFRAWSKKWKKIVEDVGVLNGIIHSKDGSIIGGDCLMQYTGLKDKNGKEIYEGDVVLVPDTYTETVDVGIGNVPVDRYPDNHLCEVVFEDGCFKVIVKEKGDVLWKANYNFEQLKEEKRLEEIEIIGNIWENPELLTKNN